MLSAISDVCEHCIVAPLQAYQRKTPISLGAYRVDLTGIRREIKIYKRDTRFRRRAVWPCDSSGEVKLWSMRRNLKFQVLHFLPALEPQ